MIKLIFFFFLIYPLQSHSIYIKHNTSVGLLTSTDTTALDDWQSSGFVGLVFVEDIFIIPEYEHTFSYDIRGLVNQGDYWESKVVYNRHQKYKIKIKLLKLKILKWYKGNPPETDYIYSVSRAVTESLQPGNKAIISFYGWLDNAHSSQDVDWTIDYNIKDFKEYAGSPFVYAHIGGFVPVFKVLEDEEHNLFVSGCVDGLTEKPLKDFPLIEFENHLLPRIDKKPKTEIVGMYPVRVTTREVEKCRKIPITERVGDSVFWVFEKLLGWIPYEKLWPPID